MSGESRPKPLGNNSISPERVQSFVDAVEAVTGSSVEAFPFGSKAAVLVAARRVLNVAMREDGQSYPQIGRMFDRDHTTIMHSVKTATEEERMLARRVLRIVNKKTVVSANAYNVEGTCKDCGESVGMVDAGDVDGVAAVLWHDFVTEQRYTHEGPVVDLFCRGCR